MATNNTNDANLDRVILICLFTFLGVFTVIMLIYHLARVYYYRRIKLDLEAGTQPFPSHDKSTRYGTFSPSTKSSSTKSYSDDSSDDEDDSEISSHSDSFSSEDSEVTDGVEEMNELLSLHRLALASLKSRKAEWARLNASVV